VAHTARSTATAEDRPPFAQGLKGRMQEGNSRMMGARIFTAFCTVCLLALGGLIAAQAEARPRPLTTQEKWVWQQVSAGNMADLKARFGEVDENRRLSARFLGELLTETVKEPKKGVMIANAVIVEPVNLEFTQISQNVFLVLCKFQDQVVFRDAIFEKHFIMIGSHFDQGADFQRVKAKMNLFFTNASFHGSLDFRGADLDGYFNAQGAQFVGRGEADQVNFNGVKVGQSAFFNAAIFQAPVSFLGADIAGQFNAQGARFEGQGAKNQANFNGMKVGHAVFDQAVFQGPVEFVGADIDKIFSAQGARFESPGGSHQANFNGMKMGHTFFTNAVFQGPVNFGSTDVRGQFNAQGAQFLSQKHAADFNGMKVGQGAFFDKAIFKGPVNFVQAAIGVMFSAKDAQFLNPEQTADFKTMKVGENAYFNNAVFKGPVNFLRADIGGQFSASGAQFLSQKHPAVFDGLRVVQSALFWRVTCRSDLYLTDGDCLDLYLQGPEGGEQKESVTLPRLDLKGTLIHRELNLADLKLAALDASHLRVKRSATFQNLVIKESADFEDAALGALKFHQVTWPQPPANLKLAGLTYTSLSVDQPDNFPGLLGLVEKSAFNPQNFRQLEGYFQHRGQQDWADTVYIAMKNRELEQMRWYNPGRWLLRIFWGGLAGYGRAPLRLLWLSLIIVLVGAWLFDPQYLKDDKKPPAGKKLHGLLLRFFISLDQFLPVVNLRLAEHWQAQDSPFPIWLYFTVERCLGWVLIPIALAAMYTQLK